MWKGNELEVASQVIRNLQSEKYKSKNYLFLQPFDLSQVPGYLDVVSRPLDLQTVNAQLQKGAYPDAASFYKDVAAVFENAIAYHGDKHTKWIAKMARDMLKAMNKEKRNAEKPKASAGQTSTTAEQPTKKKLKLLLKPKSAQTGAAVAAAAAAASTTSSRITPGKQIPAVATGGEVKPPPTKKPKIKLKLSTAGVSSSATAKTESSPKLKISTGKGPSPPKKETKTKKETKVKASTKKPDSTKIKLSTKGAAAADSNKPTAIKAKPTAPKLRLTLKTKKLPTSATAKSKDTTTSTTPPATTSPAASKPSPPKIKVNPVGPSRGKELPQAVVASQQQKQQQQQQKKAQQKREKELKKEQQKKEAQLKKEQLKREKELKKEQQKKEAQLKKEQQKKEAQLKKEQSKAKKKTKRSKTPTTLLPTVAAAGGTGAMTLEQRQKCAKVLLGVRRRQAKKIAWFLQPVSDKAIVADYKAKIKHPMDLTTLQAKLDRGSAKFAAKDFVLDLRRIFANCLRYNTSIQDSLRPVAVEVLETAESLVQTFALAPPLLFCWKLCIEILDSLYNLQNPTDRQPTALYFLHPVSYYCGGKFPPDYLEKIAKPMDFGTVTACLLEGKYQSVEEFSSDCRLVIGNCHTYYSGRNDGKVYIDLANRLNEYLTRQLDQLARYAKSSKGAQDRAAALQTATPARPPPTLLAGILTEIRALKYTDKATKITEAAMGPFERPVSLAAFPDYLQFVSEPMDLQSVDRKVNSILYATPEDFEYDVNLIFRNCEVYNGQRGGDHLVSMAKYAARHFRRIFHAKMRVFEDPATAPLVKPEPDSSAASTAQADVATQGPSKKIKISTAGMSKGKSAPRISITASQVSSAALDAAKASSRSPKTVGSVTQKKNTASATKSNQPVPLHIAIARVKEAFPLRRTVKSLQSWEADCARYFKELMRHPWISAARPKFIFHVPVPTLFPELREAYASKIRKPMDLTTVECTLLAVGNRYSGPEDFVRDIALVFANAIRFNKDGRDVGDPLSCAYYDASIHLLRYSRWLSLELLSAYVDETSEYVDEPGPGGLPPLEWRLTGGNRKKAREEMEALVMKEPLEKSIEGDRYTWTEAEAEKLLKALRHQSDLKHMTFFIQANYPADYTAFIAKPMDWEKIQRTLKKRQYDVFSDVIGDLRLIFSNALKYNARLKGTDTVSGRAYDSALYMSKKLEAAINKLMLSVSDRLERERIDHANAEREIEAAELAEEAKIRAAWKKDRKDGSSPTPSQTDIAQRIRNVRRAAKRREVTDFEMPFFDEEDNGQHESSYFEVVKLQKSMYEKQTQDLSKLRDAGKRVGVGIFARLFQRDKAREWTASEAKKITSVVRQGSGNDRSAARPAEKQAEETLGSTAKGSSALVELERQGRQKLQLKLAAPVAKKRKPTKRKRPLLDFE